MAEADEERLVFCNARDRSCRGPMYSRTWSRARERLETGLLRLYGRSVAENHALVLPSGMTAIGAVMSAVASRHAREEWTLVYGDELYTDVKRTVQYVVEAHAPKVESCAVDVRDGPGLRKLFSARGRRIRLFHFEACTNPSGQLFDFGLIEELRASAPECLFVCDNTWLSAALFEPFAHGADVVVESMTKYVSGGRCIGGAVIGPSALVAPVLSWIKTFGIFVAADHCEIFLKGLESVSSRVAAASAAAEDVARRMEDHPAVDRVMHPMLASHPTHGLAQQYLTRGGPGCVWFHVAAEKKAVMKALAAAGRLGFPECKTSFGGRAARLDPWPAAGGSGAHDKSGVKQAGSAGAGGTWIRLALGYEQDVEAAWVSIVAFLAHICPRHHSEH